MRSPGTALVYKLADQVLKQKGLGRSREVTRCKDSTPFFATHKRRKPRKERAILPQENAASHRKSSSSTNFEFTCKDRTRGRLAGPMV
ncbi:hypothetical protein SERLADRAFT_383071 [Serpula lacrymans var. lacrymans S7.9]|uniref:Uncharacterized protein n=1 Tax=Serpula lacrymans var. lacrymans (strain S7.9) TaxID=578457 RepID=F8NPL3_SERL9|nr:uncharacterized protein SERLADRAFT_383071 [Serpula lacrymans var. lacrymans S7.9]EGO27704.1 hypothetical protein SERLADRAFT_383071 [Serpula lacrymans var. lacrymans S7.9]